MRETLSSVHRVEQAVDWPPGHVACYLIGGEEPTLVDAGMRDNSGTDREAAFRQGIHTAGYDVEDIEHLVVTHPHVDHIGLAPTVVAEAEPTVYAPAGVQERFKRDVDALGTRVRNNARTAGITGDDLDDAVAMAVESLERDRTLLPPDEVDVWLAPGRVSLGPLDARAVHVPGHQADHLAFLADVDGERTLLAGDMAIEPFRAVALHDGLDDGVFEAFGAFYQALERLADLDVDRVYPGHGPVHTDFDETIERDRAALDRQLQRVIEQVEKGLRTVPAIAKALAGDRPVRYMIPEAMAALAYLENERRVTVTLKDGVRHYFLV